MAKTTTLSLLRIKRHFQVTLPSSLRKILNIQEGDFMEAEVKDSEIILRPRKLIDPAQAWFWSKEWQKGEKQADKDIVKDRLSPSFIDAKELTKSLRK